jgi:hypothetical protein
MSQAGRRTLLLDIRALPTSSTLGLSGGRLVATLAKSMTVALTAVAWVSAAVASDAVLRAKPSAGRTTELRSRPRFR